MPVDQKTSPEFDHYAETYDQLLDDPARRRFATDPLHFHRRKWPILRKLLDHMNRAPSELRWLDVGCGRGELLTLFGSNFQQAMGCDPSTGMLASSDQILTMRQTSPLQLPFADRSVDLVTAVCVFHHVHGEGRSLLTDEIRRVLAPGGLCCIIEHNPWNPVAKGIVKRCPVDADAELLTAAETRRLLQKSGFKARATEYFLYAPESLYRIFGPVESLLGKLPLGGQYAVLAQLP